MSDDLLYPVFWVQSKPSRPRFFYRVVNSPSAFVPLFNYPWSGEFTNGMIYDSMGRACQYAGECGALRLRPSAVAVIEPLILPSIFAKLHASISYYGPKLENCFGIEVKRLKQEIVDGVEQYEGTKIAESLRYAIEQGRTHGETIELTGAWILRGPTISY